MYQYKAKDSELNEYPLCFGNISKKKKSNDNVHLRVASASRVQLGIPRVELGIFLDKSYYSGHVPIMHL